MDDLDPDALAECGDVELDDRPKVQPVTEMMIYEHVLGTGELPAYSAKPFALWLHEVWNDFADDGDLTNGQVISGALADWRGQ